MAKVLNSKTQMRHALAVAEKVLQYKKRGKNFLPANIFGMNLNRLSFRTKVRNLMMRAETRRRFLAALKMTTKR